MRLLPAVIELVVSDMAAALAFYRRLGVEVPTVADDQPHVDVDLGNGMRLAFDTEDTIRSFDPGWSPPTGGHRMALAFACDSPAAVDAAYTELTTERLSPSSNRSGVIPARSRTSRDKCA